MVMTPEQQESTDRAAASEEPRWALEVCGFCRRWDSFALEDITLRLAPREYCVILGPSGSGKTLLLESIAGLHVPERGQVVLYGQDVTRWPPESRRIGFVYQNYHLFPHLSVAENVGYGLRYLGLGRTEQRARLREVASTLNIEYLLGRRTTAGLSGGEMQKVALARALVIQPQLLLLDEPLSALDQYSRDSVFALLAGLRDRFEVPVLHVTHDYSEALGLADKIAVLFEGQVVQEGPARDVFWRPRTREVARFLGVANVVPARIQPEDSRACRVFLGQAELVMDCLCPKPAREGWVCIRPEDLASVVGDGGRRNVLRGRLLELSDRGFSLRAVVDLGGAELVCFVPQHQVETLGWQVGREVALSVAPDRVHVLERES